ncbi:16S rRNA (cytosine(1402)-N(4))-methyltransferase RsmH [Methylogaea oryzae]|uniref:Ribosomal RNA small subunit methyltransferase H n=1 Tax=Methylogaea oryzae TaxID=1295382 RepID=A0A8D4VS22_9GAMM|nr:16S rRNA (cytosine(1402)-N(4))-methyltransferase RsmH [Methylogaea oryzae]BBL72249.1 ribosomal RNA small subunit methyltransferase H [Methylogaea oryzae]
MRLSPHLPVLLSEAVDALSVREDGIYVDCTFGRGGHSRALLDRLGSKGRLVALDKDRDAVESTEARALSSDSHFTLIHTGFVRLAEQLERLGLLGRVDGILMDLGVSSPQLDTAERGFSFMRDGPLDMRMDVGAGLSAAEWLARVPEGELADVLRIYGEERFARRISRAVVEQRTQQAIVTTGQLARLIDQAVPHREPGKHPATRSFQAIRIYLNDELGELEQGLAQTLSVLKAGGRLAVIAFHSLEDRMVKRFMRDQERGLAPHAPKWAVPAPTLKRVGKAIYASEAEVAANPRARSAVMRVAERLP